MMETVGGVGFSDRGRAFGERWAARLMPAGRCTGHDDR